MSTWVPPCKVLAAIAYMGVKIYIRGVRDRMSENNGGIDYELVTSYKVRISFSYTYIRIIVSSVVTYNTVKTLPNLRHFIPQRLL